jgi:MFS family permease
VNLILSLLLTMPPPRATPVMLFFAATITYIDGHVIGVLKPTLQAQFGWSEIDYADIVPAFQLAYAIGLLVAGRLIDRIGRRHWSGRISPASAACKPPYGFRCGVEAGSTRTAPVDIGCTTRR